MTGRMVNGPAAMTGPELRAWRKAHHLTQAQAAEWWHGEPGRVRSWRRWETGESRVPAALVARIRAMSQRTAQ